MRRGSKISLRGIKRRYYLLLALLALALWSTLDRQPAASPASRRFPHYAAELVLLDFRGMEVHDGDTFRSGSLRVRILGIDTPEVAPPGRGSGQGQPYGREATEYAVQLFRQAAVIEYLPYREDRYGRLLAHVFLDGELFAVKMVETSLAYETISFYGDNGFPDLAGEILQAARRTGKPPFQEPSQWRREHRNIGQAVK